MASVSSTGTGPSTELQTFRIESNHSMRPLWLVKVPKYLSTLWEKASETDELVGEVTVSRDVNTNKTDISLKVKVYLLCRTKIRVCLFYLIVI